MFINKDCLKELKNPHKMTLFPNTKIVENAT